MNSSAIVTLATCLIIAAIVTQSASVHAFQGSQDRAKRLFWVDKKSSTKDDKWPSDLRDTFECFKDCNENQFNCELMCGGDSQQCHSLCKEKKVDCTMQCLITRSPGDVIGQ